MTHINDILQWVQTNQVLLYTVATLILALLRMTAWGKAKSAALNAVAASIEEAKAGGIKACVAAKVAALDPSVARAVEDAVNTVSADKPTPTAMQVFLREILPTSDTKPIA